jgi:hypothetical protein
VMLDGATGQVVGRVTLPSEYSRTPCGFNEYEPKTLGPIAGSNGHAYLLVRRSVYEATGSCNNPITVLNEMGWTLLDLTREGQVASIVVDQSGNLTPEQLLPDGTGRLVLRVSIRVGNQIERRLIRFDDEWQRSEHVIAAGTRIDLVGAGGILYLQSRSGNDFYATTQALNVTTFASLWTASPGWNLVAAKPNGGGTALGSGGELLSINATGQLDGTATFGLATPVFVSRGVVGQGTSTGELKAVAFDSPDATRWYATLKVSSLTSEPSAFGNSRGQLTPQLVFHTNYNAIEIETNLSPDEIFDTYIRTFAGVNPGPYASVSIPGGAVSGIGQRMTFTLKPLPARLFQPPFQVETIRYAPSQRTLSAHTINPVHPLFGWRYWRVFPSANGVTIETVRMTARPQVC